MSKNQQAQSLAYEWLDWLQTRSFFGPPPSKSILAMLSDKSKPSRQPPNARLSAEIAAFHVAVCGLPDDLGAPFIRVYCKWPEQPIKTLAFDANIDQNTYYSRAHRGAEQAMRNMRHVLAMAQNLGLMKSSDLTRENIARENMPVVVPY